MLVVIDLRCWFHKYFKHLKGDCSQRTQFFSTANLPTCQCCRELQCVSFHRPHRTIVVLASRCQLRNPKFAPDTLLANGTEMPLNFCPQSCDVIRRDCTAI